jgi:IclR family acetate operon transcriptional repressor
VEADATQRQDAPATTRAVERALRLVEAVARADGGERLTELARATRVPASTALRLLRTLEGAGFVRRDAAGTFHPGAGLLALATVLDEPALATAALPYLHGLVGELGETANLGVLDQEGDALYLAQVQSPRLIRYASWRGRRVPGQTSAIGRALHGEVPGHEGYVVRRDTVEDGVTAIAAPVRGRSGAIVAALSVTGPSFRIDDAVAGVCGVAVLRAAAELSAQLGG